MMGNPHQWADRLDYFHSVKITLFSLRQTSLIDPPASRGHLANERLATSTLDNLPPLKEGERINTHICFIIKRP